MACLIIPAGIIHNTKKEKIGQAVSQLSSLYLHLLQDSKALNDFFTTETTNAAFFTSGESLILNTHKEISTVIQNELHALIRSRVIKLLDISQQLNMVNGKYDHYNLLLDSMVYLVYKRGYENTGLKGELHDCIVLLENTEGIDESVILQLKVLEIHYFLKNEAGTYTSLLELVSGLKEKIAENSMLKSTDKELAIERIDSYTKAFSRIFALDEQMGIGKNQALKAEFEQTAVQVENLLTGILNKVVTERDELITRLNIRYVLFLLFIFFLAVLISYFYIKGKWASITELSRDLSAPASDKEEFDNSFIYKRRAHKVRQIYDGFRSLLKKDLFYESHTGKALNTSEVPWRNNEELMEILPQSVYETDFMGNYTYVNKAWYKSFGYSEKDLKAGLNINKTLTTKTGDGELNAGGNFKRLFYLAIRKDGSRFPASVYSEKRMKDGKIIGRCGIIIDITENIDYIQNLQTEKNKAKSADELKSSFLANMSHEIRTPLNSIVGFSNLLALEQVSEIQRREFVNYIQSSSEVLLNLIDDIIDISKIEAGELKINKRECELRSLGGELYKTLMESRKKFEKEHIQLLYHPVEDIQQLYIKTDPLRLQQIITNLVNNALKFTEHGSVEFGYRIKDEKSIEFYVKDTGVGLSRSELEIVFQRFRRSRHSEEKNISGTGLGLAISKNLVQLLGGEMWVDSCPGKGTAFFFTIPYLKTKPLESVSSETFFHTTEFDWTGKKILVVEDDLSSYRLIQELLRKTQARVFITRTGEEAVEICRNIGNLDLVVMDIRLPGMDGIEAIRLIKEFNPDLPVIAHTAFAMAGDRKKMKDAGFIDYISKPVDVRQFLSIVNHHISRVKHVPVNSRKPFGGKISSETNLNQDILSN